MARRVDHTEPIDRSLGEPLSRQELVFACILEPASFGSVLASSRCRRAPDIQRIDGLSPVWGAAGSFGASSLDLRIIAHLSACHAYACID